MKRAVAAIEETIINQCSLVNGLVFKIIGVVFIIGLAWLFAFILLPEEASPHGGLFKMAVLVLAAFSLGMALSLARIPPMVGMMVVGVLLRTIKFFHVTGAYIEFIYIFRKIILAVILPLAGLGIDHSVLKKNIFPILKLSIIPCIAEASGAAVASYFIVGLPWLWGFLLGFLLSSTSPAVVVPILLNLRKKGYGEDKGIGTIIIAAACFDDIFSIVMFGFFEKLIFKETRITLVMKIMYIPLEVLIGFGAGISWGLICALMPHRDDHCATLKRSIMIGIGGCVMIMSTTHYGYHGSGPLACMISCFLSAICWKMQSSVNGPQLNNVTAVFKITWLIIQPILFSLIGAEIDLTTIEVITLGYSISIIMIGLVMRILSSTITMYGSNFTWREQIFINLTWIPKATVQASLGPHTLEMIMKMHQPNPEDLRRAKLILTSAFISIFLTAPIGSLGTSLTGEKLLNRISNPEPISLYQP